MDYEKNATMNREEAINVVRNIYQTDKEKEALSILIPELAESEDERIRKEIIHYILYKADGVSEEQEHSWVSYLEKQKEQKPAEWSDTDNIGWDEAFACVTRAEKSAKNEEELQNAVTAEKWLKEIKFKYYVHPVKQEWSEEDEAKLEDVLYWFEIFCYKNQSKPEMRESLNWLKSLPMRCPKKTE